MSEVKVGCGMSSSDTGSALTILNKRWSYRGEGNANLVLALPQQQVILRLHKTHRDVGVTKHLESEEINQICREAFFCRTVIVPLLGKAYIQPPVVVCVKHREIQVIDQLLLPERPRFRRHKGIRFGCLNIYPDYALLPRSVASPYQPTYCVEIKPKQGWIPNSDWHYPKCTFCLNQYLKLSNGAISEISYYCPLDLFSGVKKRMKKALRELLRTPQNNLKIFRNGKLLYSGESFQNLTYVLRMWLGPSLSNGFKKNSFGTNSIAESCGLEDRFCTLVYRALTSNLLGQKDYPSIDSRGEFPPVFYRSCCSMPLNRGWQNLRSCTFSSVDSLPKNCILERILWMQKLQEFDASTILRMMWKYKLRGDYDYVQELRAPVTNRLSLDPVQRYLLATTAKDCSILITFQELGTSRTGHSDSDRFIFNIGVSDLDPKPISCIEKHRKRDEDIQYIFSRYILPS